MGVCQLVGFGFFDSLQGARRKKGCSLLCNKVVLGALFPSWTCQPALPSLWSKSLYTEIFSAKRCSVSLLSIFSPGPQWARAVQENVHLEQTPASLHWMKKCLLTIVTVCAVATASPCFLHTAMAPDALFCSILLTPVLAQEQTSSCLRASSAAVTTYILHCHGVAASWGSCGQRSARSLCLWAWHRQPSERLAMCLPCSWPLISSLFWLISFQPGAVWLCRLILCCITEVVMPNLDHIYALLCSQPVI